jgi:membrane-associated phospholipid phosphatase
MYTKFMHYIPLLSPASIIHIGVLLGVTTLVLILMDVIAERPAHKLDLAMGRAVIGRRTAIETTIMHAFSWLGGPYGIVTVCLVFALVLTLSGRSYLACEFGAIVALSTVYVLALKLLTARKRPKMKALELERTYSFPSAHSLVSTVVYLSIAYTSFLSLEDPLGFACVIAFVTLLYFIGISRIYLGCHYVSDVLAGFIGGLMWTALFIWLSGLG